MNLLITGAFQVNEIERKAISDLGYDIDYLENELVEHNLDFGKYEGVICNGFFLHNKIKKFHNLKFIQVTSAGLDRLPMDYIAQEGITVYNAKDVYSTPMAEWVVSKILELYKQSRFFYRNQLNHEWKKNRDIFELSEQTACIVGYGFVGNKVARLLKPFNIRLIGVGKSIKYDPTYLDEYVLIENLKEVLKVSDIVILTLPLTDETKYLINKELLAHFKKGSVLINVSRGKIINENDLISSLRDKTIRGAALDVFESEPLESESDLWNLDNVLISPHNSFVSANNQKRLLKIIRENLRWEIENSSGIS